MKFLADVMLGKLVRWLRMLGISTAAPISKDDDALIRQASTFQLILLTRDKRLFQKAANYCKCFLLKSPKLEEQILDICREFKIDLRKLEETNIPSEELCPVCNGELVQAKKADVKSRVPKKSYLSSKKFWQCKVCKQVFWPGSHNKKILSFFNKLKSSFKAGRLAPKPFP